MPVSKVKRGKASLPGLAELLKLEGPRRLEVAGAAGCVPAAEVLLLLPAVAVVAAVVALLAMVLLAGVGVSCDPALCTALPPLPIPPSVAVTPEDSHRFGLVPQPGGGCTVEGGAVSLAVHAIARSACLRRGT
jgi:hypothetical protein